MGVDVRDLPREQITVLGPGSHFKGELALEGIGKLLGTFDGTIRAAEMHIGQGGVCRATIEAGTIVIDGTHQGDLTASVCLQLASHANVQGDVTATELVVAQGATFAGRCLVGPDALANAARVAPVTEHKPVRRPASRPGDWLDAPVAIPAPAPPGDWLGQPAAQSTRPWVAAPVET
jgi:cytoskeletal protein CcmA (bactofilin family)